MKRSILFASIICVLAAASVFGAIPKQINYQGILAGPTGTPLPDSTVDVEFNIFNVPAGGNSVWAETLSVTTDNQGRFNVTLGLINPIEDTVFRQPERYLSLNVESDGELPRIKLVSMGYSNRVSTVDGAKGGTITGETAIVGSGSDDVIAFGVSDPNVALELRSGTFGGDPYIDFANDAAEDYDARIQLNGEKGLEITVDSSFTIPTGKVGLGTSTPGSTPGLENMRLEIADANGLNSDIGVRVQGGGATGSGALTFAKSRGNLVTPISVISGDQLGNIVFQGHDGTDLASTAAWIKAAVDGTPGTDDMPGRLEFLTTPDGSATPSVRMTINNAGNVGIGTASPTARLAIMGAGFSSATTSLDIVDGGALPLLTVRDDARIGIRSSTPEARLHIRAPGLTTTDRVLQINTWTDAIGFMVLGSGDVGIGTSSPAYKLEVSGPVMMEDASAPSASAGHSGIYSSGGELRAFDASGNSTLLSPHDSETGEWIFYSKNVKSGRVVKVDMERLVRKVEELTGETFLMESWEK